MVSYLFCWLLLQASFGAVSSGTQMFAFSEMSFPLFSNLTFHKHIILYMNGKETSVIIARWEMENVTITSEWKKDEYIRKIFMDIDKTPFIWICKGNQTDSAKYVILYDINTPGPEVALTIMDEFTDKKQLNVCPNSPPNLPEKCFGKLTEEQVGQYIEKWLDDHPQFMKRYFGNLIEENIGAEFRKWLDDHPGFMKKYFEELTEEQIGQEIQKWLDDHPELFKKYFGKLTEEQIGQEIQKWLADHPEFLKKHFGKLTEEQIGQEIRKWLADHPEFLKKHFGSSHLVSENSTSSYWTVVLQSFTLLVLTLYICFDKKSDINSWRNLIIARLPCHQLRQEPSHKDKDAVVVNIEEQATPTDDQVKIRHDHPDFMERNLEKLTDDQIREHIQQWLGVCLVFIKKHLGKLTEHQIAEQIQKWLGGYPGLCFTEALTEELVRKWLYDHPDFIERNPGSYSKNQEKEGGCQLPSTTTPKDLGASQIEALTDRDDNLRQRMSSEENSIVFEISNPTSGSYIDSMEKKGENQPPVTPAFKDLGVALKEPLTEGNIDLVQRMFSEENGIFETTNLSSGSYIDSKKKGENQPSVTPTFKDLGVALKEPLTEGNIDLVQRMSSEENGIIETTNFSSGSYIDSKKKGENQPSVTPTFEDLGVALKEPLTEGNIDLVQRMPSEENGIIETTNLSSGSYIDSMEKKGENQLPATLTFEDLGVELKEPLTEGNINLGQRMSSEENGIFETTILSSGTYIESSEKKGETQLHVTPAFKELGVTLKEPLTKRNIAIGQRISSVENGIFETTNLSSESFNQSGCSFMQPINKEGDKGQTKSLKKPKCFVDEDSDPVDPTLPLLGGDVIKKA